MRREGEGYGTNTSVNNDKASVKYFQMSLAEEKVNN